MFDDFNNMQSNPNNDSGYSERDRLEIDSDGKKRGEKLQNKRQEKLEQFQNNKRGIFSRNSGYGGFKGRDGGSWLSVFLAIAIVVGLIYLPVSYKNGTLPNPLRSLLNNDPQANADKFMNDIQKFKKEGDKAYENRWSDDYDEKTAKSFYDVNPLYNADYMGNQVDAEYVVMVYTGDDTLDKPFIDWIENYEKTTDKKTMYKIYRIPFELAQENYYVKEAVEDDNYNITVKPLFMIYHSPTKDKKVLDSIIDDSSQLDKFPEYMKELVSKDNSNR